MNGRTDWDRITREQYAAVPKAVYDLDKEEKLKVKLEVMLEKMGKAHRDYAAVNERLGHCLRRIDLARNINQTG